MIKEKSKILKEKSANTKKKSNARQEKSSTPQKNKKEQKNSRAVKKTEKTGSPLSAVSSRGSTLEAGDQIKETIKTKSKKTEKIKAPTHVRKGNSPKKAAEQLPNGKIRIIPLGGMNEIGKNLTVIEYENDIIIVDCGLGFPDEDMLGIDLVIPDVSYLEQNKGRIKGIFLTHGHEDHIGAIPYVLR